MGALGAVAPGLKQQPSALRLRDPFDTLRADFPQSGCAFPPPATAAERAALESAAAAPTGADPQSR